MYDARFEIIQSLNANENVENTYFSITLITIYLVKKIYHTHFLT
jgi:hypothetical protein